MVFPIIGEFPFNGHMPVVLVLTVVFGFAIAAVSYALVESPWPSRAAGAGRDETILRHLTVRLLTRLSLPSRDDLVAHR